MATFLNRAFFGKKVGGPRVIMPRKRFTLIFVYGEHTPFGECMRSESKVFRFRADAAGEKACRRKLEKVFTLAYMDELDDENGGTGKCFNDDDREVNIKPSDVEGMYDMGMLWDDLLKHGYCEQFDSNDWSLQVFLGN